MNLFTFVATILIICLEITNSEAAPRQRGQGREDLPRDPSRTELTIVDEREHKEAGHNLQEKEEEEQEKRRQVAMQVKDLLRQLRQRGRWTVRVKAKRGREDDDEGEKSQNWESDIQPRDSRAELHGSDNSHGTLISKGW